MRELSIFVDESGDWGEYKHHSPYYIITFVFHNQDIDISDDLSKFDADFLNIGYSGHCLHAGPIIRGEILTDTEDFADDLKKYPGVISPDGSLYIDAPLCVQIADIYLNRAVGYYLSQQGIYVIPNIRCGDECTYTDVLLGEKVAFQGVDKHSIVSVGTYGQIQTAETKWNQIVTDSPNKNV